MILGGLAIWHTRLLPRGPTVPTRLLFTGSDQPTEPVDHQTTNTGLDQPHSTTCGCGMCLKKEKSGYSPTVTHRLLKHANVLLVQSCHKASFSFGFMFHLALQCVNEMERKCKGGTGEKDKPALQANSAKCAKIATLPQNLW